MNEHILLVDDENAITNALRRTLSYEGYAVLTASDGERALALAHTKVPDLIILDLMLPGIDGLEVCRRLRATHNEVPILMLTARDRVVDRVVGLETGADDYLVKPFALEELLARIKVLLRRHPPSEISREVLCFSDLELDTATRQAKRGDVADYPEYHRIRIAGIISTQRENRPDTRLSDGPHMGSRFRGWPQCTRSVYRSSAYKIRARWSYTD